jgi:hypothetical protein
MGVITDFFLASTTDVARVLSGWQLPPSSRLTPSDLCCSKLANGAGLPLAAALEWAPPPNPDPLANPTPQIDSLPNVQCTDMLPDKLALLFSSLTAVPEERALDLIMDGYLTGPPDTEITVQQLPEALTSALANAQTTDLVRAAKTLEEDDLERWGTFRGTAQNLLDMLHRVQSLAKRGISSNADLFLWTCT